MAAFSLNAYMYTYRCRYGIDIRIDICTGIDIEADIDIVIHREIYRDVEM